METLLGSVSENAVHNVENISSQSQRKQNNKFLLFFFEFHSDRMQVTAVRSRAAVLFPPEIWVMVLEWLISHSQVEPVVSSLLNVRRTCHMLRSLIDSDDLPFSSWIHKVRKHYVIVQTNGWDLGYAPEPFRTPEVCLTAVKQNGNALGAVPESLRSSELCLIAVKQCGRVLRFVPEPLRTLELCLVAVQRDGGALQYVPDSLRTYQLQLVSVQNDGHALKYAPRSQMTSELCLMAVRQNGDALKHVPQSFRTTELCLTAVQKSGWLALLHVPENLKERISFLVVKDCTW